MKLQSESSAKTILIAGASGTIGSSLKAHLVGNGHTVFTLVRRPTVAPDEYHWDPLTGVLDPVPKVDVVFNFCGEDISQGRWTAAKKERIRSSRIRPTQLLAKKIASKELKASTFISTSATGYYGSRGDLELPESTSAGEDFLATVCQEWEAAAGGATGVRVITARLGVVLTAKAGALKKMYLPFLLGLGGTLGAGSQWCSWVSIRDVVSALEFLMLDASAKGPFNIVSPHPVRNREFTRTLGTVLKRPAYFPIPAFVLRMLIGEMADAALLGSTKAVPSNLVRLGYRFLLPDLQTALEYELKANPTSLIIKKSE